MNNFFAGKVIFARKCQIFDPVVRLLSRLQLFSRLQLSRTTLTFRNDFNFPERLSLVCYSTLPTNVYLKIECNLVQILWTIGFGGT